MVELLKSSRGGFLRPFGCAWFIREFLLGNGPMGSYVVAPRIRWQGMIANSLASFWSQELSEAWSGMEIEVGPKPQKDLFQYYDPNRLVATDGKTPITEEMRRRAIKLEQYDMRPPNKIMMDLFTNLKWVE